MTITLAQTVAVVAGLAAFTAVVVGAFRLGKVSEKAEAALAATTLQFAGVAGQFDAIAKQAASLATLAATVAVNATEWATWRGQTEHRVTTNEAEIVAIRARLHALGTSIQTVVSHQAMVELQRDRKGA